MDTEDLRKFLAVAKSNNLQSASLALNVTPGALSKTIKRLEDKLNTQLFDRIGRNIQLNQQGEKFSQYASHLVHEADQAISEFTGTKHKTSVKLSGPSLLIQHFLPRLLPQSSTGQYEFSLDSCWEGKAINQVSTGQSDLALVTQVALDESSQTQDFEHIGLGNTQFKVVAAASHPLFEQYPNGQLTKQQLYWFGFACPNVSPFCGIKRGIGSDGWRDDKVPRTISHRCNDFSVLTSLVSHGSALAYVPDFVAKGFGFEVIDVLDCDYTCEEHIVLVFKPSLAAGWLTQFTASIRTHLN